MKFRFSLCEEVFHRQVAISSWCQGERLRLITRTDLGVKADRTVIIIPDDTSSAKDVSHLRMEGLL